MVLDSFVEQVSPLPDHDYLGFVPADPGLAPHAFSRAYINFSKLDDIITFRDRFDGYVFVDKQGTCLVTIFEIQHVIGKKDSRQKLTNMLIFAAPRAGKAARSDH